MHQPMLEHTLTDSAHPMKPHRIRVTHDLVAAYDMLGKMDVLVRILTHSLLLSLIQKSSRDRNEHRQTP